MNRTAEALAVVEKEMQLNTQGAGEQYQALKVARRVNKKGQDDQVKVRHPSDASHCSSEKSVGEVDAAESLIVLSSIQQQRCQVENVSSSEPQQNSIKVEQDDGASMILLPQQRNKQQQSLTNNSKIPLHPMDLSPSPLQQTRTQHHPPAYNNSKPIDVAPMPPVNSPPQSTSTGYNQPHQTPPAPHHRQVMTVTPVADHVALVDTVLNAPSIPTMVIPMNDDDDAIMTQHRIQRVIPNQNMVFPPKSNLNGTKLLSNGM